MPNTQLPPKHLPVWPEVPGARWAVPESGPRVPTDTVPPRDTQERSAGKSHSQKLKVGGRVGEGQMTGASLGKIQKHPQTARLTRDFTQATGFKANLQNQADLFRKAANRKNFKCPSNGMWASVGSPPTADP